MSWTGLGAILTSIRKRASARYEKDIIIYQALFETNGHRPLIKFTGTIMDLALPWCLAYMIDDVVPLKDREQIYLWGGMMLAFSAIAVINNIAANRMASRVARDATRNIRHDLYSRISMLSCQAV